MGSVRLGDPLILAAEVRTFFWPIPAASAAEKISAPPMQRLGFCEYSTQLRVHFFTPLISSRILSARKSSHHAPVLAT
jgi:hypothetical protein